MTGGSWPWGGGAAPPLHCCACKRQIGKRRVHLIFEPAVLLCARCADDRTQHARRYAACDKQWHDMWDHLECTATRAAAWFALSARRSATPTQRYGPTVDRRSVTQPDSNTHTATTKAGPHE